MTQSIPIYQIDAFTDRVFGGNPAAVCPLEVWLPEDVMQAIAAENNLAETAFYVPRGDDFDIRWFTPVTEIALAGHPTLATAYLLFTKLDPSRDAVRFHTKAGDTLDVTRDGDLIVMDFPTLAATPRDDLGDIAGALRTTPLEILAAADGLAVFATEEEVRELVPDPRWRCSIVVASSPPHRARRAISSRASSRRRWAFRRIRLPGQRIVRWCPIGPNNSARPSFTPCPSYKLRPAQKPRPFRVI